jgi:23S rRNA (adenine2030-N6)-methyltransferase
MPVPGVTRWSRRTPKLGEYKDGIGRLWDAKGLPPAVTDYVDLVRQLNPDGQLALPRLTLAGPPVVARRRPAAGFEMHSTDIRLLQECFKGAGRAVTVSEGDGFAGLKALLPPPTRRALVLIDPSYETKSDYTSVIKGLQEALRRFPTGTYALWYPMLAKLESRQLPDACARSPQLAARHTGSQGAGQGRFRHERQRHVHHQPAMDAGRNCTKPCPA